MMMISGDALMGNFMGEKAVKKNAVIRTAPAVAGDSLMGNFMGVETNSGRKVFDGSLAPRAGVRCSPATLCSAARTRKFSPRPPSWPTTP